MEKKTFETLNNLADIIHDEFHALYEKGEFKEIEAQIKNIAANSPEDDEINFKFLLNYFSEDMGNSVEITSLGLSSCGKDPVRVTTGGNATSARYLVHGVLEIMPHDYCHNCYGEWDFKLQNPSCPECGAVLGEDIKLLIDSDICPMCEKGKLSRSKPVCNNCGFKVDDKTISWG